MEYICPYCGNKAEHVSECYTCHRKIEWVEEIWKKSNSYYNSGYEAARERNLTLAIEYLQQALDLNKYHTSARNLLGLVYYEVGRMGDALKQWIIGHSLDKEDKLSEFYINEVQKSPKVLINYKETIHLYNKSLGYLQKGNIDMAIIRLKKAVSMNPKFVEAKTLLGLCYMNDKQFYKANEQIKGALSYDRGHLKALSYFKKLSGEDTQTVQPYEMEFVSENQVGKQVKPIKVIDRGISLKYSVLYFVIGAIAMFMISYFLIYPNEVNSYQQEIAVLQEREEQLSKELSDTLQETNLQVSELEAVKLALQEEINTYENQLGKYMQKEKLSVAKDYISEKNYIEAASILYNVAGSLLEEESKFIYEELKLDSYASASTMLYNEGYQLFRNEDYAEAKSKLETVLLYEPSGELTRKSLLYLGQIENKMGNLANAQMYFNRIITDYPDTYEGRLAKEYITE